LTNASLNDFWPFLSHPLRRLSFVTTTIEAPSRWRHRRPKAQQTAVVVFDGDDTLWETERLYDDARTDAAKVVAAAGVDPGLWEDLQRTIDVANVDRLGLSAERFPTSCVQAYVCACDELGMEVDETVATTVRNAASQVFEWKAQPFSDAEGTLKQLSRERRLILLTQGDPSVQRKRVADSSLRRFFTRVVIVDRKTPSVLAEVLAKAGADPSRSWFVGNSIPSDVNPALAVGMSAIWIEAHVWTHERREALVDIEGRCVAVDSLSDVPAVVSSADQS